MTVNQPPSGVTTEDEASQNKRELDEYVEGLVSSVLKDWVDGFVWRLAESLHIQADQHFETTTTSPAKLEYDIDMTT